MKLIASWRALTQHPVYLREKGEWGTGNPYYDKLRRYSPFVVLGVLLLGACTGSANPALFADGDEFGLFWCLLCLPGIVLSSLTLFGLLMVPALTAPTVCLERSNQTWDILRVTPQPTRTLLFAKLFGALARLRAYWWLLFVVSTFYGLMIAASTVVASQTLALTGLLLGASAIIRPWLEILFAGLVGMLMSLSASSTTTALVGSYTVVVLVKIFISLLLWTAVALNVTSLESGGLVLGTLLQTLVYLFAVAGGAALLVIRARAVEY